MATLVNNGTGTPTTYALGGTHRPVVRASWRRYSKDLYNAVGWKSEEEAYAAGAWYLAALGSSHYQKWIRDHGITMERDGIKAQQQVGDDSKGGYAVPAPLASTLIDLLETYGVIRRFARNVPMTSNTLDWPKNATRTAWTALSELEQMVAADKTFSQVNLVAKKFGTLTQISSEIQEDAVIDMAGHISQDIAIGLSKAEDESGFAGDGTATYNSITGIINALAAGATHQADTGKTTYASLDQSDFDAMIGLLKNIPGLNPRWYCSRPVWATAILPLMHTAQGNTLANLQGGVIMPNGSADFMAFGYPGTWTNAGQPTGAGAADEEGGIIFGDLSAGVLFGTRRAVSVAVDSSFYFDYDALAVRGTERFDVQVHETGGATEPGVICMLKLAAA